MKTLLAGTALGLILSTLPTLAQELRVGAQNVSSYLDPGEDHSNVGSQFYYNAFDTLIERDHTGEGEFVPALATEWQIISDTAIEFTIREGVQFHDGSEMTAQDVVFSFNRMFDPIYPPYDVRRRDRLANFTHAEVTDEGKVRVHTERPEPLFETLISMQQLMIVPETYIAGLAGESDAVEVEDYEAFRLAPVGTGPYAIAEFVPGERIVYERHDGFWGESAPYERVVVSQISEVVSRVTALRSGEVDLITNLAPDQLNMVDGNAGLKTEGSVTPLFHVMIMNVNHPELQDPRIRQALSLAIDRDLLNETLWQGMAEVPSTHTMEEFGELYMPELETFPFDPEEAKRLLDEAGYDGAEITYDTHSAYYTNGLLAAQAIMEMWAQVGVNGVINVTESWTTCVPEMMTRNWSNPMYFADPFGSFGVMWAPGGPSEGCDRFNTDEAYAEDWDRFRFSTDVDVRRAAYAELMEAIEQDPPVLPLYRPYEAWGMRADLDWAPRATHIPYVLDFRAGRIEDERIQ